MVVLLVAIFNDINIIIYFSAFAPLFSFPAGNNLFIEQCAIGVIVNVVVDVVTIIDVCSCAVPVVVLVAVMLLLLLFLVLLLLLLLRTFH